MLKSGAHSDEGVVPGIQLNKGVAARIQLVEGEAQKIVAMPISAFENLNL